MQRFRTSGLRDLRSGLGGKASVMLLPEMLSGKK